MSEHPFCCGLLDLSLHGICSPECRLGHEPAILHLQHAHDQLTDVGGGTRLVTRLRILYRWRTSPFGALASLFLNEHGDFAMMRKMLRTLKQRAETVSS